MQKVGRHLLTKSVSPIYNLCVLSRPQASSDCLEALGFRFFTPLEGSFSPFPHGTYTLLVRAEYLGWEGGPPFFQQDLFLALLNDFFHQSLKVFYLFLPENFQKFIIKN